MKTVMIESPLMKRVVDGLIHNMEDNLEYAKDCLSDSLARGEAPFAMYLLYTQVLDDTNLKERAQGIECGLEWLKRADVVALYVDREVSSGMKLAYKIALAYGRPVELRTLCKEDEEVKLQRAKLALYDVLAEHANRRFHESPCG